MNSRTPPYKLKIESKNIVLRGDFKPGIFHPQWFAKYELLGQEAADFAEVVAVTSQFAQFQTEWLRMQVLNDRFHVSTQSAAHFELLRDLVTGTAQIIATTTPLRQLGINHEFEYLMDSEEAWHRVGDRIVPKNHWGFLDMPGMIQTTVQGKRPDGFEGYIHVKVAGSSQLTDFQNKFGILVNINDHFQLQNADVTTDSAVEVIDIFSSCWHESGKRAKQIAEKVLAFSCEDLEDEVGNSD